MNTIQVITRRLESLPEPARREVLDFVEFLESRTGTLGHTDSAWTEFSLASALRGMEDEHSPYTLSDVKESLR